MQVCRGEETKGEIQRSRGECRAGSGGSHGIEWADECFDSIWRPGETIGGLNEAGLGVCERLFGSELD